jgi:prepilin-type N-terminal cleavage/methylation domain-containing protein
VRGIQGDKMKMEKSDNTGFTLLELMMVVVIIAIMAAVAIPNMSGWFSKKDLDGATREIFTTIQQARLLAIKNNEEVRVSFRTSTSPHSYVVRGLNSGMLIRWKLMPNMHISFNNINFAGALGATTTGFTSRGLALQNGTITIISSDAPISKNTRTITISVGGNATITP